MYVYILVIHIHYIYIYTYNYVHFLRANDGPTMVKHTTLCNYSDAGFEILDLNFCELKI